jgi:hypothetical protein
VRRFVGALLVSLVAVCGAPRAGAEGAWSPPVEGAIIDPFRPPATPYGPGNRGVDYATSPGEEVRAASGGEVVFAGRVGLSQHVVVLHPDGLRTSYSFLAEVDVRRGDHLERGDVVGRAGDEVHFGVRAGDTYLDPTALLRGDPPAVHLVPVKGSVEDERRGLLRSLVGAVGGAVHVTAGAIAWVGDGAVEAWDSATWELSSWLATAKMLAYYIDELGQLGELLERNRLFLASQDGCTPADVPPRRPKRRRIALLVGGLGSSSGHAAILDVDTRALGYADGDVAQFSYRGGQSPGERHLAGVTTTGYSATDSEGDLREAADRFRAFVDEVHAANPGVPIDVLAHSQGGVVARAAGDLPIDHLVTLGSPHHGAVLASAATGLSTSTTGQFVEAVLEEGTHGAIAPSSPAVAQLAERSDFTKDLERRPVTEDVTSIAARGDLVVPANQSALRGATNVLVRIDGVSAHDSLPGSPAAGREIGLALADQGPTCRSLFGDLVVVDGIVVGERGVATGLTLGGLWADHRFPSPHLPSPALPAVGAG